MVEIALGHANCTNTLRNYAHYREHRANVRDVNAILSDIYQKQDSSILNENANIDGETNCAKRDFIASGIQINLPERNNQSGNALSFGVASVNGEVIELSNQVLDGAYPAYLTVLEYLPFDTSQEYDSDTAFSPIYSLTLFVTSCQVTTKGATITAGWHDTLNAKFPFKRYTAKQFKGLRYVC